MFKNNSLPSLDKAITVLDFQRELAFVCHYLINEKYATKSGKYHKTLNQKPLFRDYDKQHEDKIFSMDRKSGDKLLAKPMQKINDPKVVSETMRWIVQEFPVVTEKAQEQYKQDLSKEENYTHIIVAAAHTLSNTKNPKNYFELMEKSEKIFIILGLGLVVLLMAAFYRNFAYEVHLSLAAFNGLSVLLYIMSYELEYDKPIKKHPSKEYRIMALALFLCIYMALLINFLPSDSQPEYFSIFLLAVTLTLFLQAMCFYFALTRLVAILNQCDRTKVSVVMYKSLLRYKKNIGVFHHIWFVFIAGSIMMVLSAYAVNFLQIIFAST